MSDLIDRQAAIKALDSINCFGWVEDSWKNVCSIIEHVPAAQLEHECEKCVFKPFKQFQKDVPKRNVGKWIKVGDNSYKCSVCDEISCCNGNFCPDCGAKMEGEKDERAMG